MKLIQKAIVAALFVLPLAARAEDRKLIEKKPVDREPTTEMEFLIQAISCDVAEVKLAESAVKKSSDKDVEKFARELVADHTKSREALLERARAMKLAVVEGLEKEHQEKVSKLAKLEGKEFDREFMNCMVESHEKALARYQTWATKASDKDLADTLDRTIPTLKKHLEAARDLAKKLK